MASELEVVWDGGAAVGQMAPEEAPSETGRSTRSTRTASARAAKAKGGPPKPKRGAVVTLSSSFTCWKNTPETYFHFVVGFVGKYNSFVK